MASPRKKTTSAAKTSKKKAPVSKKKTTASKKRSVSKKTVPQKVVKKTSAKSAKKTVSKKTASKATTSLKKPATKTVPQKTAAIASMPKTAKKKWYSIFTFTVIVLGLIVAGFLALHPETLEELQANLITQENNEESAGETVADELQGGILIAWKTGGENEAKLKDIFQTVFPETSIYEVPYDSEKGKELVGQLGVKEVPAIFYEEKAFEEETLSEVVKDLFELKSGYYALNVSLVNPSHQLRIAGALDTEGAVVVGEAEAPLNLYLYSDPKCQHCRVNEQNNLMKFAELAEEGLVRIHFLDLPQSADSYYYATALACVGEQKPADYIEFRSRLFSRANLSNAYAKRELSRLGLDLEEDCKEAETRAMLRLRTRDADAQGITGVPAVYVGKAGENEYIRITGAKDFSEFEAVFDELLDGMVLEGSEEEVNNAQ